MTNTNKLIAIIRTESNNKPIIFFVNQQVSRPHYIKALTWEGHIEASIGYYRHKTKKPSDDIIERAKSLLIFTGYDLAQIVFKQKINYSELHKQ